MGHEDTETWEVDVGPGVKSLGLTPHLPPGRVSVIDITDGGWAQKKGIQIGDEIFIVAQVRPDGGRNDAVAAEMTENAFTKIMRSRPLVLTFRAGSFGQDNQDVWEVHAGRRIKKLGFTPHLPPGPVTILSVESGGWAESEHIQIGDEIIALNDEPTLAADMSAELFTQLMTARSLTMTMKPGADQSPQGEKIALQPDTQEGLLHLSVGSDVQTLGLTPSLPPGTVVVQNVVEGSWAEDAGVRIGDEILTLNSEKKAAAEMSENKFKKILRSRPLTMTLRQIGIEEFPAENQLGPQEEWVVEASSNIESLGLTPHLPPGPVIIVDVQEGGWSERQGIQAGDEIVALNGEEAATMSEKSFSKLCKTRPLEIMLRHAPLHLLEEALQAIGEEEEEQAMLGEGKHQEEHVTQGDWVVEAGPEVQRLGLAPNMPPGAVTITYIEAGGWAESQGIEVGDEIIFLNEEATPAAQMQLKKFQKVFTMRPLKMTLRQGAGEAVEGDAVVTAGEEVEKLGFTPHVPPGPVVVISVEAGGWAESEGIRVNDEILFINDEIIPAAQMDEQEFITLMKERPVRMVMRHGQPSFLDANDGQLQPTSARVEAKESKPGEVAEEVPKVRSPRDPDISGPKILSSARKPENQDSSAGLPKDGFKIGSRGKGKAVQDTTDTPEFYANAAKEQLEQQEKERSAEIRRLKQGMNEQSARHEAELESLRKKHEEDRYKLKLGFQEEDMATFYAAEKKRMQDLADARENPQRARLEAAELARALEDAERARHEAMNLKIQLANVAREEVKKSKEEARLLREQLKEVKQPLKTQGVVEANQGAVVTAGSKVKSLGLTPRMPPGQVIVLDVQAGGWAESVNIQPGDEILAISNKGVDIPTVDMSQKEFQKLMKLRPLQLLLKRMPRNFSVLPPSGGFTRLVISGARQLRIGDPNRDPPKAVCTCTIVGKSQTMETQVADQTANPWWNYETEIKGFAIGDSLKFVVHDASPTLMKEFLGEVTMNAMNFVPDGFDGQLELLNRNGDGTRQKLLVRVELLGTPVWKKDAEHGRWNYVVVRPEGIGVRRTPRFDKREELAEKLDDGQLITVVERRYGDGVMFMRLESPRGWIIELLPGRGLNERLEEVTVESGSWRYRVMAIDGLEFRSRCTVSEAAKNGAGLRVGSVAIVTERVKVRQRRFLKVGVKGWLFDRSADDEIVMVPVDVLAIDDDFAESVEKSKLRAARQQEERKKQQDAEAQEEKRRRQQEAYDQEVERQAVELAYQDWWRNEEKKHHEAEAKKRRDLYENHDKDYDDLRHGLAMQRHEKALKQYEEAAQEEKAGGTYTSGFSHLGAATHRGAKVEPSPNYTRVADKKVQKLGLEVSPPPGEVVVNSIVAGSWADKQGIRIGDELLGLGDDGKPASKLTDKAFSKLMGKRPLQMHFRRTPASSAPSIKKLDMSRYQGPDPVLEAKIGVAIDAIEKLRRGGGYSETPEIDAEQVSHQTSPTKTEPDPEPTWAGLTKQLGAMDAAVDDLHWGALVTDGQARFQRPKVGPAPSLENQTAEASARNLLGGLEGFQAQKLASNLASVCAGAFYWSTNMHDHERRQLVELLLSHLRPCAQYDRGVMALIQDLDIERARLAGGWEEEPAPVPIEWSPALVQEPRRQKLQSPARKPPDLSRTQRPLLFDDPVLASLLAWNKEGSSNDANQARQESAVRQGVTWDENEDDDDALTFAEAMQERLRAQERDTPDQVVASDWGDPRRPKQRRPKRTPQDHANEADF